MRQTSQPLLVAIPVKIADHIEMISEMEYRDDTRGHQPDQEFVVQMYGCSTSIIMIIVILS